MNTITFKRVELKDLQQAITLAVTIFGEDDRQAIEQEFKAGFGLMPYERSVKDAMFFMALKDGKPVGITGCYKIDGHDQDLWLNWMGVLPEARGMGIGTALVDLGLSAQKNVKTLRIWTTLEPDYDNARRLYTKMGFIEEPYKPGATDGAKMVVVFTKSADGQDKGDAILWRNTSYPIDCEGLEIEYLNRLLGIKPQQSKQPLTPKHKTPRPHSP